MDPENEQPQLEPIEQQETTEQQLQSQLAALATYSAKAIRLGIAAFTGGLSKIGESLLGIASNWVVGGISFGGLHGPGPKKPSRSVSFFYKYKTSLLLLALVVGAVLLPLVFVFTNLIGGSSAMITTPVTSPSP